MDAAMIARWNSVVASEDEVWHLGDFARTSKMAAAILPVLNGRKHLIIGNNDPTEVLKLDWISVQHYAEITVKGIHLVLCHYPFRTWNGHGTTRNQLAWAQSRRIEASHAAVRCRCGRSRLPADQLGSVDRSLSSSVNCRAPKRPASPISRSRPGVGPLLRAAGFRCSPADDPRLLRHMPASNRSPSTRVASH
jgi:hypothetical protein